jgi:rod shape-determining protein MreC
MLDIHRRTGYLFLVVVLLEIILISMQVQTSAGTKVGQAVAFGIFSQVQIGSSSMFGGVRHVWDGYFALRGAHDENQRLKEQVAGLELRLQQQQALARRGALLEQMLAVREQTSLKTLAANVIALDATGMFWTVTIDRGSEEGVKPDMAVIAPQGVVGRVVEHGAEAAKVQLLVDRNAGAGAVIERSGAGGVVVGNDSDPPLQMDFVANLADVKVGDRVVTSGLDGIYPPGFVIGHVEKAQEGKGLYKHIEIRPIVDFRALQTVLVVLDPPEKPKPGEGPGERGQLPPAATTQNQPAAAPAVPARPASAPAATSRTAPAQNTPAQGAPAAAPERNRPAPARTAPVSTAPATPPSATPPGATPPGATPPAAAPPAATPPATTAAPDPSAPATQRPATPPPVTPPPVIPPPAAQPAAAAPGTPVPGGVR